MSMLVLLSSHLPPLRQYRPPAHTSFSALIWQCPPPNPMGHWHNPPPAPHVRGLHSSTVQLNVSDFRGIGGAFRGYLEDD